MTTLSPTRYSEKTNSTFFEAAELLVTLDYEVVREKRWLVVPGALQAHLTAKLAGGTTIIAHSYEIPRDRRVGDEITALERGLYKFVDEVVRAAAQLKALEAAQRAVTAVEDEHLFEGAREETAAKRVAGDDADAARGSTELDTLIDRLLMAVRHLTNITSLTREGLHAYQSDRSEALANIWRASSLTAAVRVHGVLQAVEAFVRHEADSTDDLRQLRLRTREHLFAVRQQPELREVITPERVEIIVAEAVPEFLALKKRYDEVSKMPKNIFEHTIGSFFGGGFAGFFAIDLIGESVLSSLLNTSIDLPGFAIGAVVTFVWPYMRGGYGWFVRERWLDRKKESVLRRLSKLLDVPPPARDRRMYLESGGEG